MIELSRLSGEKFWVNADLVRELESTPDTLITFLGDTKVLVKESPVEIRQKIFEYKSKLNQFQFKEEEK